MEVIYESAHMSCCFTVLPALDRRPPRIYNSCKDKRSTDLRLHHRERFAMKNVFGIIIVLSVLAPAVCPADGFEITSLSGNGMLSWTNDLPGVTCRVEWASSPDGPWTNTFSFSSTGEVVTCEVPMLYRVVRMPPPEICDNGIDDDGDGFVDGDDWDCCKPEEICDNGIDDDCDGFIDNQDWDCCNPADPEICDNGIDDDCDGLIDDQDPDCACFPTGPENCFNGIDDDCDGFIDGDDFDCP